MNKKLKQNGINTSVSEATATSIELDDKNLWVQLADAGNLECL